MNFRAPLWAAILLTALSGLAPVSAEPLAGAALVQQLRQGGYVLLMRHAHAPATPPEKSAADPANSKAERQLDEAGRQSARAMGEAFKTLRIPLGVVLSSPTYRALQTARLAGLPAPETHDELGDGGHSMSTAAVGDQAGWLRQTVAKSPKAGVNTVIITHMPNIQSGFAQDAANLADGEALIFRPDGRGGAALISRVKIEEWPILAGGANAPH
jgi:phosphohistidine phosphatase SixA